MVIFTNEETSGMFKVIQLISNFLGLVSRDNKYSIITLLKYHPIFTAFSTSPFNLPTLLSRILPLQMLAKLSHSV